MEYRGDLKMSMLGEVAKVRKSYIRDKDPDYKIVKEISVNEEFALKTLSGRDFTKKLRE